MLFFCFPGNSRPHAHAPTWKAQKQHSSTHPLIHSSPRTRTHLMANLQQADLKWWRNQLWLARSRTFHNLSRTSKFISATSWRVTFSSSSSSRQRPQTETSCLLPPLMSHVCTWTASNIVSTDLMTLQRESFFCFHRYGWLSLASLR